MLLPDPVDDRDRPGPMTLSVKSGDESASTGLVPTVPEVSPFTGALGYKIPIVVPPGRNGIAPNLALTYSSQARNGLAGIGWTIDLGSIQRNTKYGLNYANNYGPFPHPFVAAINGAASDLVYNTAWSCFESVVEGAFSKYCFANNAWIVYAKGGTKYYYGTTAASRQDDPADSNRIFKWCLDRVEDTNGNYMTITYLAKDSTRELYPSIIQYTGNTSGLSTTNQVDFTFETRPVGEAIPIMYTTGFPVQTAQRLKEIGVKVNDVPAGKYTLTYDSTGGTIFPHSLLQTVTRSDDATPPTSLPSIGLSTYGTTDTFTPETLSVGLYPLRWLNWVGDFNGDGKSDIVTMAVGGNTAIYNYATGAGGFTRATRYASLDAKFYVGDFNGDGKTDIVSYETASTIAKHYSVHPPADLLHTVTNGIGATTTIAYTPSSTPYPTSPDPVTPYFNTLLPFVVQTVGSITVDDGNGVSSTTEYRYASGLHIHADREFYGFGYAVAKNPVGTLNETFFLQREATGVPNRFKGLVSAQRTSTPLGSGSTDRWVPDLLYTYTKNFYSSTGAGPVFPYLSTKDEHVCDGTNACRRARTNLLSYDTYGNVTGKEVMECTGTVAGIYDTVPGQCVYTYDKRTEYTTYTSDIGVWILNRPLISQVYDGAAKMAETLFAYDGYNIGSSSVTKGNLTSKEDWNNRPGETNPRTTYTYDSYGNQTSVTDPNNNTTTYTYETAAPHTYVAKVTNALYHMVDTPTWDYKCGKPLSKTAPYVQGDATVTTSYEYDGFGRPWKVVRPGDTSLSPTVEYTYNDFGTVGVQRVTTFLKDGSPNDLWSETYFDGLGRTVAVRKESAMVNNPIVAITVYTPIGTVATRYLPCFAQNGATLACQGGVPVPYTAFTYDPIGRVETSAFHGDPVATTYYAYDKGTTTVIDPMGHVKDEVKDIHGRLVTVHEYTGMYPNHALYATTEYAYDVLNNLITVTDDPGNITTMAYSSLSRKVEMWDPDMGHWTYGYDLNGNLTRQTDAKSQVISFMIDALNRVQKKCYGNNPCTVNTSPPYITYTYDACEADTQYCRGKLASAASVPNATSETTSFVYDQRQRTASVKKNIAGAPANPYTTQYTYDSMDRTVSIGYPTGSVGTVYYTYDSAGNLYQVGEVGVTHATYENHTALGQPGTVKYHDPLSPSATTTYTYSAANARLARMVTVNQSQTTLQDLTYGYSTEGTISGITDGVPPYRNTQTFDYDVLHRLTGASGGYGNPTFSYNEIGNMTNSPLGNYAYPNPGSAHPHAATSAGGYNFTYDENGNMTSGMGRTYTWTYDNKPAAINGTSFTYDYSGRRIIKVGASTTYYIDSVLEHTAGTYTSYIFAGGARIAKKVGNTLSYYHGDHLKSTNIETDLNGNKTFEACYKPYGETWYQSGTEKYKFTDQEEDTEVSLYNYGARHYDPLFARFVSPDSIVPDPADPQTLNRYSYCRNNPVMYVDPSGHDFGLTAILIGAAIGALTSGISSDWDATHMAIGAVIGGVSGGIFSGTQAAVSGALAEVVKSGAMSATTSSMISGAAAGAAAGAVAGGIGGAVYGGNIGQEAAIGAGIGAAGGALFGAISKSGFKPFGSSAAASIPNRFFNSALVGGAVGAGYAGLTGGDVLEGVGYGAMMWAGGEAANMIIGHGVGLIASGGQPPKYNERYSAFVYDAKTSGWITFSNVITGPAGVLNYALVVDGKIVPSKTYGDHEAGHMPQGTILGPAYVPAQGLSMLFGGVIGSFTGYGVVGGSHKFGLLENMLHPVPAGW